MNPIKRELLDLHRINHIDAEIFIDRFINTHWGKNILARIITGNSETMKDIAISKLNFYDIKYTIGNEWQSTSKSFIDFLIE